MRIWSIHPKYLDSKGLVALWREALLAKNVLEGKTKGYRNHPQLERFKKLNDPLDAINYYLSSVYKEALKRKYNFDTSKFNKTKKTTLITVSHEQVEYEFQHLLFKLKSRDKKIFDIIKNSNTIITHPIFTIVKGPVEPWEII